MFTMMVIVMTFVMPIAIRQRAAYCSVGTVFVLVLVFVLVTVIEEQETGARSCENNVS